MKHVLEILKVWLIVLGILITLQAAGRFGGIVAPESDSPPTVFSNGEVFVGVLIAWLAASCLRFRSERDQWRDAATWIAEQWGESVNDGRVPRDLLRKACVVAQSRQRRER